MKKNALKMFSGFLYLGLCFAISSCGIKSSSKEKEKEPLTYSLGIDSLGLELPLADSVVLRIDDSENITMSEDGIIEYASDYEEGQSYSVSIVSSSIMQHCELDNESGTFVDDHIVVYLTCTDKTWTHPASLSDKISVSGQDASNSAIAMDNNGNAIVVWAQSDGSNEQIFKSEYRNGAWTHPASLSDNISPDLENAFNPQLAMDDNGNAVITWSQEVGVDNQVFKSEYRNGAWTHPASLSDNISPDGEDANFPQIAMDNNGNAIITWYQSDNDNDQVFKSEYRSGSWTHPANLDDHISPSGEHAVFPQVAMDNNGNALIIWQQYDGSDEQIFKSEYRSSAWTHPANLSDNISPNGEPCDPNPQVAMDDNGNALITWAQNTGGNSVQIFKSEYRSSAWTHPANLNDNISPDGQPANDPQVAMDNNGNALITWAQSDSSQDQIYLSEYRNSAWVHPADLNDHISVTGQDAVEPLVAMDDIGNAIITWIQYNGTVNQTYKSEYRKDAWVHPTDLSDSFSLNGQFTYAADLAMNNDGEALISWHQYDASDDQIFLSEFR